MKARSSKRISILTVGHSTRPLADFLELLAAHGVERLVDVRTIPRSRRNPQFNTDALAAELRRAGIAYTHLKALGGLRHPRADSTNLGWRNASFRGYADYMATPEFSEALDRLLELGAQQRCAVMCAEAVPWRCHRSLIGDALAARGITVEHILSGARRQPHHITPFARIEGRSVTYPALETMADAGDTPKPQLALEFEAHPEKRNETKMPSKRRKPKFMASKEARRRARTVAGAPPAERVIPDKRRKPPKHKRPLEQSAES